MLAALVVSIVVGPAGRRVARAEEAARGFVDCTHGERRYVVFVPAAPAPPQGYPLILFLHSAGERGTDGRRQLDLGLGPAIRSRADSFPGIVVFPQADYADGPILETWRAGEPAGELARAILADVERRWPVDPQRRALTGWSMGAYGALSHAAADPEHFSRVLAIAGGGEPEWGPPLATLPVWLVHGADDRVVPPAESRTLISHVPEPHTKLYFSEVPSARHDVARSVYDNQAVLDWLLSTDEAAPPVDSLTAPQPQTPVVATAADEEEFSADLVISRAISLRLGNEALRTLADGVPHSLEEDGLHGTLSDVADRVEFDGQSYDVRFGDMSYQGRLQQVLLEGRDAGRLQVGFALRNFEIRIGSIEVSSSTDAVTAADVRVVIGHREPVWLDLEVQPVPTDEGLLRLQLHGARFEIGDHNWYVDPPGQIRIRGELFTPEMVTTAIVGGVYQRKSLIEEKIVSAVEPMLRQVEKRVDFSPLAQLVTSLWPLPVYQPRLQVRLEEVATDADGVSLVFGCAAADPAGPHPRRTARVTAAIPPAAQIAPLRGLRASVGVDVVEHLSRMLAGTEAMSIYAADLPGRPFQELDDVQGLSQTLEELQARPSVADVRSRLALTQPFHYTPLSGDADETTSVAMAIEVPELSLTLFAKEDVPRSEWAEVARRELNLQQPLRLEARPQLDGPTELVVTWGGEATISSAGGTDEIVNRCRQGWNRWAGTQQMSVTVPDVAVGSAALRLDGFCWEGDCLTAQFQPAATVLVNRSDRPVEYCVRSEHSRWCRPLRLPPHTQHIFRSGVPLQIRSADRWSREGQRLEPGTYEWSGQADAAGRHWSARPAAPSAAPRSVSLSR